MKGLELCRRFWHDWGLPYLESEFPELVQRAAASRTRGDSDTICADDELSRDHAWGPHFNLCLTDEDYNTYGDRLRHEMNRAAPEAFLGFSFGDFGRPREKVTVTSIDGFFADYLLGFTHPPPEVAEWSRLINGEMLTGFESQLYFLQRGEVFHDPLGEFTARRAEWARFPNDIYHAKLSGQAFVIWHCGLYTLCNRQLRRRDPWCIQSALGQFMDAVMGLFLELRSGFAPYYKWLAHEFRKLSEAEVIGPKFDRLTAGGPIEELVPAVEEIAEYARGALVAEGLLEPEQSFGPACVLRRLIADPTLRWGPEEGKSQQSLPADGEDAAAEG